jgi:hypothetical protein
MTILTPSRGAMVVALLMSLPPAGAGQTSETRPPVDAFLEVWLLKQDPVAARQQFVSVQHVLDNTPELRSLAEATDWIQRVMTMWLFADHGLVTQLGHGDPSLGAWRSLPTTPAAIDGKRNSFDSIGSAITASSGNSDRPYDSAPVDVPDPSKLNLAGKRVYVVTFRFRQLPRDALLLIFGEVNVPSPAVGPQRGVGPAAGQPSSGRTAATQSAQWKLVQFSWTSS